MDEKLTVDYRSKVADSLSRIIGAEFAVVVDRVENITPLSPIQKTWLKNICTIAQINAPIFIDINGDSAAIDMRDISAEAGKKLLGAINKHEEQRILRLFKGQELLKEIAGVNSEFDKKIKTFIVKNKDNDKAALDFIKNGEGKYIMGSFPVHGAIIIEDINVDKLQKMEQNSKEKGYEIIEKIRGESLQAKSMAEKVIKNAQKGDFTQR
jgi:hypothetical protein